MTARSGAQGPEEQAEDSDERDAARGAMSELDEGRSSGVALDDGAVAERPVISTTRAGAGGAYGCSPENDGDVVDQDSPGIAIQGWGIGMERAGVAEIAAVAAFIIVLRLF